MTRRPAPGEERRAPADQTVLSALSALDPVAELAYRSHLEGCDRCRRDLAALLEVSARLADALSEAAPDPGLRDRIVSLAVERRCDQAGGGRLVLLRSDLAVLPGASKKLDASSRTPPARQRRRRPPGRSGLPARHRLALAAASLAVVAGGLAAGLALSRGGIGSPPETCTASTGCRQVELTSTRGHVGLGTVILQGRSVWLRPSGLPADSSRTHLYVLWEIADGRPRANAGFDVAPGTTAPLAIGSLPTPPGPVRAFAVSLEPGRTVPELPSDLVAVGPLA